MFVATIFKRCERSLAFSIVLVADGLIHCRLAIVVEDGECERRDH